MSDTHPMDYYASLSEDGIIPPITFAARNHPLVGFGRGSYGIADPTIDINYSRFEAWSTLWTMNYNRAPIYLHEVAMRWNWEPVHVMEFIVTLENADLVDFDRIHPNGKLKLTSFRAPE